MSYLRIVGVVLLILNIIPLIVGMNASDSLVDLLSSFFTDNFTETTMWYTIGLVVLNGCNCRNGAGRDIKRTGEATQDVG